MAAVAVDAIVEFREGLGLRHELKVGPPALVVLAGQEARALNVGERRAPAGKTVVVQPGPDLSLAVWCELRSLGKSAAQCDRVVGFERFQAFGLARPLGGRGVFLWFLATGYWL